MWEDLSRMSDEAVIARRDSLGKAEKGALLEARAELGTLEAMAVLEQTRGNVEGMASLVTLLQISLLCFGIFLRDRRRRVYLYFGIQTCAAASFGLATAGYGTDGKRFGQDIRPHLAGLGIDWRQLRRQA